ncbi:hypothetical protein [Novosphingobium sp. KA1]|uniref:hypothetical protein n=1 Tax=Novosphingobium sp. (strain KA1) TaxID=164608 RepID=UPI001A8E32E5|nr:hypothetical protein [Novosphingobium sp. KA1]
MSSEVRQELDVNEVLDLLRVMDSFTGYEEGPDAQLLLAPVRRLDLLRYMMASLAAQSFIIDTLEELAKANPSVNANLINARKLMAEVARAAAKSTGLAGLADRVAPVTPEGGQ